MSPALPEVLAIDGGNSKTDVALVAADGSLLATARGPGMPGAEFLAEWLGVVAGLVAEVRRRAGTHGNPVARHISACVANVDLPEEEERTAAALRDRGWSHTVEAVNDTFAVLRAGLDGTAAADRDAGPVPRGRHWGVGVTCGAGINCVGVDPAGRTTGYLALGDISGDWGGGNGLGREALWWAARAEDGRGPETRLREAVAGHFGVPTVQDVTLSIHLGKISKEELRRLAPVLVAVARDGDQVARDLVRRQAEEICVMAVTAMRRLGLTTRATPVVLGGGLMTARDPLLLQEITDRITAAAPRATVIVVAVPPVAGAALLGLDHVGARAAAERRLRATYEGRAWS